jgi:segregation and condensation protein A
MASERVQESAPAEETAKAPSAPEAPAPEAPSPSTAFLVALPHFEGPLDLLLHLIREHRVDIFDIPIALITEKYLEALKAMRESAHELDLDVAGEFLLMAATLVHIKSRMLLPDPDPQPAEEEAGDPREELVRRLLQYQKFRAAADELARHDLLDRDVFARRARLEQIPLSPGEVGLVEVSVFKLIEALDRALAKARILVPHQVFLDRVSLGDAINAVIERLKSEPRTSLASLLGGVRDRQAIVVTFLALLEMCKLGLIRVFQELGSDEVLLWARDPDSLLGSSDIQDDYQ